MPDEATIAAELRTLAEDYDAEATEMEAAAAEMRDNANRAKAALQVLAKQPRKSKGVKGAKNAKGVTLAAETIERVRTIIADSATPLTASEIGTAANLSGSAVRSAIAELRNLPDQPVVLAGKRGQAPVYAAAPNGGHNGNA